MHYVQHLYGFQTRQRLRLGRAVTVYEGEQAVLFRNGRVADTLGPGRFRNWRLDASVRTVDMRPWVLPVPTQEVPTADGTTVKVTLAALARVTDAVQFVTASQSAVEAVYLAVQLAVRVVVGTTTVEDLLAGRPDLSARLLDACDLAGVGAAGVAVDRVELKDLILSSELKRARAEVLVARAQGLAALERARGETAAMRSLANAARAVSDNPALLQLRLLQELGATTGHTVIVGMPPLGTLAS